MSVIGWLGKALGNRIAPIKPLVRFGAEIDVEEGKDGAPKVVISRGPLASAHAALMGGIERLVDLARAGRIDPKKLKTLHEDGGVEAFETARQAAAVDADRLDAMAGYYRFRGIANAVFGALALLSGLAGLIAFGEIYLSGALLAFSAVFATASAMDSYRAWQFRERRFGSLAEWFGTQSGAKDEEGK